MRPRPDRTRTGERLRASLDGASRRIVIVGAGLVGSELANDFALAGHQVTLLGTQALPLPAHLPAQAAYRLIEAWRNLPLSFVGHSRVTSVERSDEGIQVRTTSGRTLMADEVIAATGLRTPRRLARSRRRDTARRPRRAVMRPTDHHRIGARLFEDFGSLFRRADIANNRGATTNSRGLLERGNSLAPVIIIGQG